MGTRSRAGVAARSAQCIHVHSTLTDLIRRHHPQNGDANRGATPIDQAARRTAERHGSRSYPASWSGMFVQESPAIKAKLCRVTAKSGAGDVGAAGPIRWPRRSAATVTSKLAAMDYASRLIRRRSVGTTEFSDGCSLYEAGCLIRVLMSAYCRGITVSTRAIWVRNSSMKLLKKAAVASLVTSPSLVKTSGE